jgi:hypothetical protein
MSLYIIVLETVYEEKIAALTEVVNLFGCQSKNTKILKQV